MIKNFRGIKSVLWNPNGLISCLVGPGDSNKTTILDAIELALSPRWNVNFSDVDFYKVNVNETIEIQVTLGGIPDELLTEDKYGLCKRGWLPHKGIIDEPDGEDPECECVLSISLKVGSDLEPKWSVITNRQPEGVPISWRDRARLGLVRLGAEVDRDFTWSKFSVLTRLCGDLAEIEAILADAHRKLREAIKSDSMEKLLQAAKEVENAAKSFGVSPTNKYEPRLDSRFVSLGMGSISLHDGEVPLMAAGLGTRRLIALAIQRAAIPAGAIVLIDEIEHGLEPHRIRRLIRSLKRGFHAGAGGAGKEEPNFGQIIFTTHTTTPILELDSNDLNIVRISAQGETIIKPVPAGLQGIVRYMPHAILGRKCVICEGETEVGLFWGLENYWQSKNNGESVACKGVEFISGEGSAAPGRAKLLCSLGFEVAYFGDSDKALDPSEAVLKAAGIEVILWEGKAAIEDRFAADLPLEFLQEMVATVISNKDLLSVANSISAEGKISKPGQDLQKLQSWLDAGWDEGTLRMAIGKAAKKNKWFKSINDGKSLAKIIIDSIPNIEKSDTITKLRKLEDWCYGR
jgi:hypothetical protein